MLQLQLLLLQRLKLQGWGCYRYRCFCWSTCRAAQKKGLMAESPQSVD